MTANGHGGAYRYYACSSRVKYGAKTCYQERLPAADVERDVMKHIIRSVSDTTLLAGAMEELQNEQDQQLDHTNELGAVERELRKARTTIDRYPRAYKAGSIPEEMCGERLHELREQAVGLESQLVRLANEAEGGRAAVANRDEGARGQTRQGDR